jgi:hypothetical protein
VVLKWGLWCNVARNGSTREFGELPGEQVVLEVPSSVVDNSELINAKSFPAGSAWNPRQGSDMLGVKHSFPKDSLNVRSSGMERMIRQMNCADLLSSDGVILRLRLLPFSKDCRSPNDRFFKKGLQSSRVVAPIAEPVEEQFNLVDKVRLVGNKGIITVYHTNYSALKNPRGMTA